MKLVNRDGPSGRASTAGSALPEGVGHGGRRSPWRADELAKKFEDYEPAQGDQVPVEEYLRRRAALTRARSEREVVDAVAAARSAGISWNKIGDILGTSAQAAQQRYSAIVEQT
jgi:hypothetical protein